MKTGSLHQYAIPNNIEVNRLVAQRPSGKQITGIAMVKIENLFLDSGCTFLISYDAEGVRVAAKETERQALRFRLKQAVGKDLFKCYLLLELATRLPSAQGAEYLHEWRNQALRSVTKEIDALLKAVIEGAQDFPIAIRLLDHEIIFKGFREGEQTPEDLIEQFCDTNESQESKSVKFLRENKEQLAQSLREIAAERVGEFLPFERFTKLTVECIRKRHRQRPNGSQTAILIPNVSDFEYFKLQWGKFFGVVVDDSSEPRNECQLRIGIIIEEQLQAADLRKIVGLGASWFCFGTNDLTANTVKRPRRDYWGHDERFKRAQVHPEVMDYIESAHDCLVELASVVCQKPLFVGFAGAPLASGHGRWFLRTRLRLSQEIAYYEVVQLDSDRDQSDVSPVASHSFPSGKLVILQPPSVIETVHLSGYFLSDVGRPIPTLFIINGPTASGRTLLLDYVRQTELNLKALPEFTVDDADCELISQMQWKYEGKAVRQPSDLVYKIGRKACLISANTVHHAFATHPNWVVEVPDHSTILKLIEMYPSIHVIAVLVDADETTLRVRLQNLGFDALGIDHRLAEDRERIRPAREYHQLYHWIENNGSPDALYQQFKDLVAAGIINGGRTAEF
jgi:hypothetical protein